MQFWWTYLRPLTAFPTTLLLLNWQHIWSWERIYYSYLKGRKQCVKIRNSDYNEIICGVPQGSILGPVLFILSINDLFFFIKIASMHNFADDNTLSAWEETLSKLIGVLKSEVILPSIGLQKTKRLLTQTNSRPLFLIKGNPILQTFCWLLIIKLSSQLHQ